ncbi:MAG: nucleoside recognition domain-containing protein, partial [Clostridiales bacterium]
LKKTKLFAGQSAPFVMELPSYHLPTITNLLRSMWERGWSFIKKAGTIILLASICIWFSAGFGWQGGHFGMTGMNHSILAAMGGFIAPLFTPIGWGNWQAAVATITGLIAKENIVGTFGVLGSGFANTTESGWAMYGNMREIFTPLSGFSFLVFNLLCAPCCAAVAAIGREMHDGRWVAFAVTYQCIFAYAVSLCIYQLGILFTTGTFGVATAIAMLTL